MARSCAGMGEADLLQKRPDIALVEVDAEPLGDDALKIDPPPAHDPVSLALRASLDDLRKLGHLLGRKPGLRVADRRGVPKNFPRALKAHLDGLPETTPVEVWFQMLCSGGLCQTGKPHSGTGALACRRMFAIRSSISLSN